MSKENQDYNSNEIIDIEQYAQADLHPPLDKHYKVKIDEEYYIFHQHKVTGWDILEKAGKTPVGCHSLFEKSKHKEPVKINSDDEVILARHHLEHFFVRPPEHFHFTVDGEPETTKKQELTPNEILEIAEITPIKNYYLVQKNADGSEISFRGEPNKQIKMQCPALHFIAVYCSETPVS